MKKIINKLVSLILAYRLILVWLLILIVFGFTLFKLQKISNSKADEVYLEQQTQQLEVKRISINQELVDQLEDLQETPVNVTPNKLGTDDPFRR